MELNNEIEKFEAWWADQCQASWNRVRAIDENPTPPPNWGSGFKSHVLQGWLGRATEEATR
jgi:hypothetical protein